MANEPANAGTSSRLTSADNAAPPPPAAAPPPVHHETLAPREPAPRGIPASPVPGRPAPRGRRRKPPDRRTTGLAWVIYLLVLAGVAAGLLIAWQGPRTAGRGAGVVGCSLLAAALARLALPLHGAGPLSSRQKASDALAFAVFGAGVLGVALMLP